MNNKKEKLILLDKYKKCNDLLAFFKSKKLSRGLSEYEYDQYNKAKEIKKSLELSLNR